LTWPRFRTAWAIDARLQLAEKGNCSEADDDAAHILERFEAIERERVGEGKHEAYHEMLHGLKDAYGF